MFESALSTSLFFVGIAIVVLLSCVAGFLHWQLYLRKKREQQRLQTLERQIKKRRKESVHSLRIIAKSYLSEQVELAETVMHCLGTGLGKIDKPGEGEGAIATIWEDKK